MTESRPPRGSVNAPIAEGFWPLDPAVAFLNHGSFGSCPRPVLEFQRELRERLERQPVKFFVRDLEELLDAARARLAAFVGSAPDDLVFVPNATSGINAVLRSLLPTFKPGDELLTASHAYRAVRQTMLYVAELSGAKVVDAPVPFPLASPDEVTEAIARAITPRTKLLVIDHITSPTGLIFPVEAIIKVCKERGLPVLIDGAHSPGQLDLDLETLGADYYVGNCHKWLFAPKGAALLWVAKEHQPKMHPTVISHFLGGGYQTEFAWTGTLDNTAFLSVPAGIAFHQKLAAVGSATYTRELTLRGREMISAALGVPVASPDEMIGNLATIPLPGSLDASDESVQRLHDTLFDRYHIEIPTMQAGGKLCVRFSSQVYNEMSELERLREALLEVVGSGRI